LEKEKTLPKSSNLYNLIFNISNARAVPDNPMEPRVESNYHLPSGTALVSRLFGNMRARANEGFRIMADIEEIIGARGSNVAA